MNKYPLRRKIADTFWSGCQINNCRNRAKYEILIDFNEIDPMFKEELWLNTN